jgi:beta-N-acetylhexosaminidase
MTIESQLAKPPFNLKPDDLAWVRKTRDGMSTADKVRQLFVHISFGPDQEKLLGAKPAGFMPVEKSDLKTAWEINRRYISESEIPPFLSQDLEGGGNHAGALSQMPNQLGFAAVTDDAISRAALDVMATEASALGFNWSFTPCIDINHARLSAIVGTRSYGSSVETIERHALMHMQALQGHGIAATAKHWPGEGYDDRDQHLVTTINPQSTDDWLATFGRLYRGLIASNIMSVMSAHIALPSIAALHGVPESLEWYRPASLSRLLTHTLLREQFGFNGLIVSDATPMAGMTSYCSRAEQVPQTIAAGSDVFLFATNVNADIAHMENGLRSGVLTEERLEEAVTRILGMKAALGLHRKSIDERILPFDNIRTLIKSEPHQRAAQAVADGSVTLVKDATQNLPLNVAKHRRITWIGRPVPGFLPGMPETEMTVLRNGLIDRGFDVTNFDPQSPPTADNTNLVLYVLPVESSLGKSRIYLDWLKEQPGMENIMSRYWHDLPTVMVSLGHPYYLYDAPRVPTYINAYSYTETSQKAVLDRLTGNAPFTGLSPVDPFAGAPDAKY